MRALMILALGLAIGCGEKVNDTGEPDGDGDGYSLTEDCDDTNPDVNPGAEERCNTIDDDCDGEIDEEGSVGSDTFYADADGDGYGDENNTIEICELPDTGYVTAPYDCDDTRADVNPTAEELCDDADNDCDGDIDEDASDATTWYADDDNDGYGDEDDEIEACDQPDGYVDNDQDCDDTDAGRSPEVEEYCDDIDNNCDGHIDEDSAVDALTWYGDDDEDGYGNPSATTTACDQPDGYVENGDDCADNDAAVNPDADELCDNTDNNCDGEIDEDGAIDAATWYTDADGDGVGDPSSSTLACDQPSGTVSNDDDCDDTYAGINPAATEFCDGIDNDCDGSADAANLITVDGTSNWGSIGQAVFNASAGSSIMVCDGTYVENVEIDKDITIESLNGSGSSTIDGDGSGPCIDVQSGSAEISGFTLTDGAGGAHPDYLASVVGGGMMVLTTDSVVLDDMIFQANEADYGAGLFGTEGCNLTITNSIFDLNDATNSGGGAYFWDCTVSLDTVTAEDNLAAWGGAYFVDGGSLDLNLCLIDDNLASTDGGGIYVTTEAEVTASADTEITANSATEWGGGVVLYTGASWTGGWVYDNEADLGGGFFSYTDGTADNEIDDLLCEDNSADSYGGCGYVYGDLTITSSEFYSNSTFWGGALFLDASITYLSTSVVEDNIVNYNGGGVYVYDDSQLWSVNSDWGTGSTDNDPDDVYVLGGSNAYTGYGTGETFSCSDVLGTCS